MPKNTIVVQFATLLFCLLVLAFFIHIFFLVEGGNSKYDHKLVLSYLVNGFLAMAIFVSLYLFRYTLKNYIGFLFMGGSFLKFIVFFMLFYPSYKADGDMSSLEFAAFFVPYGICLILETVYTAKMLQKLN